MNKKIILGVVAVVVLGGLLLYGSSTPKQEVTIGVLVPLTGKSASIGERVKAGVEVGAAELTEQGYGISVVFEDDKGEAPAAVSAAQKLINTDGVRIIIGTVKSDAMLAVAPITEGAEVLLISPTAGAEAISDAGDFVFRLIETPDIHGQAAAKRLLPLKTTAVFTAQAANAQSYGKFFKQSYVAAGGSTVFETEYQQDNIDFRTDISRALALQPGAVYLAVATAKDAGILVRQFREMGYTGPIMASVAADAPEFFDAAGEHGEGTLVTTPYFDKESASGIAFNKKYREITGKDADGFAANGYDAVLLIGKALKHCGGDKDIACIRDYLYGVKEYNGAGGLLSFDEKGDVTKPVVFKVAQGDAFVVER